MLNIAGPEYDFGSVVFAVLEECEHRRRGFEDAELSAQLLATAKAKLEKIRAAYDEFGGSPVYWQELQREVMDTAMPQYVDAARHMNALERRNFGVWRGGDPAARVSFALAGLLVGSIIISLPFVPIVEAMFAFGLSALGFLFPETMRFTHERRHFRTLNRLVTDASKYQSNARLHYMTMNEIRDSFTSPEPRVPGESASPESVSKQPE